MVKYLTVEAQIQQASELSLCPVEALRLIVTENSNSVEGISLILKKHN